MASDDGDNYWDNTGSWWEAVSRDDVLPFVYEGMAD